MLYFSTVPGTQEAVLLHYGLAVVGVGSIPYDSSQGESLSIQLRKYLIETTTFPSF